MQNRPINLKWACRQSDNKNKYRNWIMRNNRFDKYLVAILVGGLGSIGGYILTSSLNGTAVGFLLVGFMAYGYGIFKKLS